MTITLVDKNSILKRLYDDNPDVWTFAQADAIELIEKQGDALEVLNTAMPCGHLGRYQMSTENGTQYCSLCLIAERTNDVIHESIERDDLIATIRNAITLLDDYHIDAAQTVLQLKIEKVQS